MIAPLAGLVAIAVGSVLAGCGTVVPVPAPTPTATPSASATAASDTAPPSSPTTVNALPGSALLRLTVTAEAAGEEVRLQLTFNRAQTLEAAPAAWESVQEACPNAIESQLEIYAGLEPTGVITSELSLVGNWPEGMTFAVAAGGIVATHGEGRGVAPVEDAPGAFGCTVAIVTGPGAATFTSLLLGDPAVPDRTDLEQQIAHGLFGFETDAGSAVDIRWRNCVVQLSSVAQRLSTEFGWDLPAEWGDGCLIGDGGTV